MTSQLGKYEIRRELGRGAMGVVYEGYDPLIKRRVALKTIRPDQLEGERPDDVIARFRREAQAAGRLSHPNIVAIHEFDEDNGTWFIAMEFVDGRELKECFANDERFKPADIERIMTQILAALDYSHRNGVVHRDIKPANIFLLADGTVKVADFGIAHIEASNLTQVGTVVGTPNYMSPEQIMGLPVDGRSDLFSTGVILYQFLTGERPFAGSSTTTMQKVLKEDPLPPSTLNVQLPAAIDVVVRKALAKRAGDRYQSAQEFAGALRAALAETPVPGVAAVTNPDATMPNLTGLAPRETATRRPTSVAADDAARVQPSQTTAMAIVASIAVIGIAALVATWWLWPRNAGDAAPKVAGAMSSGIATPRAGDAAPSAMAAVAKPAAGAASAVPPAAAAPGVADASTADAPAAPPGMLVITAVGLADPQDPRYANDKALLQTDVKADSRNQVVAKALTALLDRDSFMRNYDLLHDRVLSHSGNFINATVHEGSPQMGKDGLMSVTMQAVVDVKAIQQSLDQLSRDERVQLIRANGDPRMSLAVTVRDADQPGAPPLPSPVAENVLKERIQSFGFRTWSGEATPPGAKGPDFAVTGEATVKKLSTRLAASGLVIDKYALASWTVKCTDLATGEEIYFNTALPKGLGSWASEEEALRAIGTKIADQFSRDFFLSHVPVRGRKVKLVISGLPDSASQEVLAHELIGLPAVINASAGAPANPRTYDLQVAPGSGNDAIAKDVIGPLNAKLGEACFNIDGSDAARVAVAFNSRCADALVWSRLETNPPAGLYTAPPARQKAVIKNPDTLRKLVV